MNNLEEPTLFEARKWASFRIQSIKQLDMYDIDFLIQKRFGFSTAEMLVHYHDRLTAKDWRRFQNDVNRLIHGEPVQYIVQQADFYGMTLKVTPAVLIPRVETEELIDWILKETESNRMEPLKVLDIGTGSGAIAIALKKNRPAWQLTASDISEAALAVASQNARNQGVHLNLILSDVFETIKDRFDLIISNPPYISSSETAYMDESVLNNEPKLALFAADNGLAVYKKIAAGIDTHLKPGGRLFVEIGFHQEMAVSRLFSTVPKAVVTTRHDVSRHQRMIELRKEN